MDDDDDIIAMRINSTIYNKLDQSYVYSTESC